MDSNATPTQTNALTPTEGNVQSTSYISGGGTTDESATYGPQSVNTLDTNTLQNTTDDLPISVQNLPSTAAIPIYKQNVVAKVVSVPPKSHTNWPLIGLCAVVVVISLAIFVKTSKSQYKNELLKVESKPSKPAKKSKSSKKS